MTKSNKPPAGKKQPARLPPDESGKDNSKLNPQIVVAVIGGIVTLLIALLSFPPFTRIFETKETPTAALTFTAVVLASESPVPTDFEMPSSTPLPLVMICLIRPPLSSKT